MCVQIEMDQSTIIVNVCKRVVQHALKLFIGLTQPILNV